VSEGDSPFGEIIRRQFQGDFVACEHADAITAQPAGQVRQHDAFVFKLNAEQPAGELLKNRASYLNDVLFAH